MFFNIEHFRVVPGITKVNPLDLYDFPYSHSLVFSLIWAAVFGLVYFALRRNYRGSLVVAACVFSHWALDLIVHKPDLALAPGSKLLFGLGLWNNYMASLTLEGVIYVLGIYYYTRATAAKDKAGFYGFWSLVVFLPAMWVLSLFNAPPPNVRALALSGFFGTALTVAWAWWADSHRAARTAQVFTVRKSNDQA